jgi:hypothetical protein
MGPLYATATQILQQYDHFQIPVLRSAVRHSPAAALECRSFFIAPDIASLPRGLQDTGAQKRGDELKLIAREAAQEPANLGL